MTFLDLVRQWRQECSLAGTGPLTVINQAGMLKSGVDWVSQSWDEIQGSQLWSWQWEQVPMTFGIGVDKLTTGIPANRWNHSAYIGQIELDYRPWETFRRLYPVKQPGEPRTWSINPANEFVVNTIPTASVTIAAERYKLPTRLAADTDVPGMPERYHMAIVWKAVMKYADEQEAGTLRETARDKHAQIMANVLMECTPEMTFGEPLL